MTEGELSAMEMEVANYGSTWAHKIVCAMAATIRELWRRTAAIDAAELATEEVNPGFWGRTASRLLDKLKAKEAEVATALKISEHLASECRKKNDELTQVVAETNVVLAANKALAAETKRLNHEVAVLRQFGNKDCVAAADNYLEGHDRFDPGTCPG